MRKIAFWLLLFFVFMIPWESGAVLDGMGTLAKTTGIFLAAFWGATVLATGKMRPLRPFHLLVMLFLLWNIASLVWSVNPGKSIARVQTYGQLAMISIILWDLVYSEKQLRMILQAYVFGAYISAWNTVSNYLAGITAGRHNVRYTGFGFNENELALILVLAIPIAWHLAISISVDAQSRNRILQIINFMFIPLALFAILLAASRTSMIALIPIFWFILGSLQRLKTVPRVIMAIALVGGLFILQPLVPQSSIDRLSTTSDELTEGDLSGRNEIWEQGVDAFLDAPILGVGSGGFRYAIEIGRASHNTYISILVEGGLIGFLIFLLIIVFSIYHVRYQPKWLATFWIVLMIAWAVGISSMNWEARKPTWLLISLVVVSANVHFKKRHVQLRNHASNEQKPQVISLS